MNRNKMEEIVSQLGFVLNAASDAICIQGVDGRSFFTNEAYGKMIRRGSTNLVADASEIQERGQVIGKIVVYHDISNVNRLKREVDRMNQKLRVSDADLASLLSNAVKNACEAATLCEEERSVEVCVRSYKQKLFLEIRNSAIAAPTAGDGHLATTKEDVENHGIGTRNMADIVEKYEGKLTGSTTESTMLRQK